LRAKGYERICTPLTNERWKRRWEDMCILSAESTEDEKQRVARDAEAWRMMPAFRKDEVTITRLGVLFCASTELLFICRHVDDSGDAWVRHDAEIALGQEISYAAYLNIYTVILPPPRNREHVASYARTVNTCLTKFPYISLSVRLPIYHPATFQPTQTQATQNASPVPSPAAPSLFVTDHVRSASGNSLNATWEMWDVIRTMCDYNTRLTLSASLISISLVL
jgi:protein arginine N-methyltransferase 5